MRSVRSKGNISTELKLISIFKSYGIKGWRRNYKINGNPDFVFPKLRLAIFVDGCFWHGHNCRGLKPATNKKYWDQKIQNNKKRDRKNNRYLRQLNWSVIRIWECKLKSNILSPKFLNYLAY